jgi:hypothetical protein
MANKRARITDRNPLTATDGVIAGYEQVDKSASQLPEMKEQQDDQPTSEQVSKPASQQAENTISKQVNKPTSQDELVERDNSRDNPATEEASKPTSQLVKDPILTSQKPDNLASEEVDLLEVVNNRSESNKSTSQQVSKPTIRKATFQVDAAILADLDRYHLQLQIEMGRRNAPYKEILVEEAIAQWLERAAKSPDRAVKSLLKRQEQR